MIADEWIYQINDKLPFAPTEGQRHLISVFSQFMADRTDRVVMLLRGSAGTGKTSVARAIVQAMHTMRQKVVLMAPTGRAAKVLSRNTQTPPQPSPQGREQHPSPSTQHPLPTTHHPSSTTIHRRIYRQQSYMAGQFSLNDNMHTDTLFIVDEASMISGMSTSSSFGSGCLLDDLIKFVYGGRNCRLMLIGDTAQLPPIGCDEAPALIADYIAGYGLQVYECDLNEVLRQAQESGILYNATMIRQMITHDDITELPKIRFRGFADICICHGNELIEQLSSSYYHVGTDETIVITRSNKRANIFNMGIRNQVLDRDEELSAGDHLMIVKNNYYWTQEGNYGTTELRNHGVTESRNNVNSQFRNSVNPELRNSNFPSFLANGDRCVVRRVRNHRELFGFRFADVQVTLPDYDDYELQATVMLDTLQSEAPALTAAEQEKLFNNVMEDYADITTKAARMAQLKQDRYFNALQIKYAYAVTCHKAQGGQWQHVYLDQGYMTDDMLTPSYIHWLYTAFTRATAHLYLVNWPKTQVADA